MKKHIVEVRNGDGSLVEKIAVTLRAEAIGNFNPVFCTYKNDKRCLVESEDGMIDDPFRRSEESLKRLFIRPRGKDGRVVENWNFKNKS